MAVTSEFTFITSCDEPNCNNTESFPGIGYASCRRKAQNAGWLINLGSKPKVLCPSHSGVQPIHVNTYRK